MAGAQANRSQESVMLRETGVDVLCRSPRTTSASSGAPTRRPSRKPALIKFLGLGLIHANGLRQYQPADGLESSCDSLRRPDSDCCEDALKQTLDVIVFSLTAGCGHPCYPSGPSQTALTIGGILTVEVSQGSSDNGAESPS